MCGETRAFSLGATNPAALGNARSSVHPSHLMACARLSLVSTARLALGMKPVVHLTLHFHFVLFSRYAQTLPIWPVMYRCFGIKNQNILFTSELSETDSYARASTYLFQQEKKCMLVKRLPKRVQPEVLTPFKCLKFHSLNLEQVFHSKFNEFRVLGRRPERVACQNQRSAGRHEELVKCQRVGRR